MAEKKNIEFILLLTQLTLHMKQKTDFSTDHPSVHQNHWLWVVRYRWVERTRRLRKSFDFDRSMALRG